MTDITDPVALGDIPAEAAHAPRAPWYRRPVAWLAAAGLAIGGLATAFALTLAGGSTPTGADAILARDGYTVTVETSDPGPLITGSGMTPAEAAVMRQMVSAAAVGTKGGTDEAVLTLTPAGLAIFSAVTSDPSMLKQLGLPAGVHVRMDHGYLVLRGPNSTFSGQAS
jgi:hypothetical protein